jgi:AcrR family transcriptional regulator
MPRLHKPRRTQEERREATIRKLLDAATAALIEVGYAEASVQEICKRAGVSHGGLFRHFATREALMVAVAEDVGHKLMGEYVDKFETLRRAHEPLELALRLVRNACRSRINQAWFELTTAARTNARLRKALAPLAERYYEEIRLLGRTLLPDLAAELGPLFDLMVDTIIAVFDGDALHRFVVKPATGDDDRLALLLRVVRQLTLPA